VAECPEVGAVSQGSSLEEAVANLREATELYLEEFPLPEGERSMLAGIARKPWEMGGPCPGGDSSRGRYSSATRA